MLLCIDFQPSYDQAFQALNGALKERISRAREQGESIQFIYNHSYDLEGELLGDTKETLQNWCDENNLTITSNELIRKNFGWVSLSFRTGKFRKIGVKLFRYLLENHIPSTAHIPVDEIPLILGKTSRWSKRFQKDHPHHWQEIVKGNIALPLFFEFPKAHAPNENGGMHSWLANVAEHELNGTVEIIGGFKERCLDEICIAFEAAGINYSLNSSLIYSVDGDGQAVEIALESTAPTVITADVPSFAEEVREAILSPIETLAAVLEKVEESLPTIPNPFAAA